MEGFMNIKYSMTEEYVYEFYQQLGVADSSQLNINYLSNALNVAVYYLETKSKLILDGRDVFIVIDSRLSEASQLEAFYHELAHLLLNHELCASRSLFEYFEQKADNLIQYLALPSYLIEKSEVDISDPNYVQKISEEFGMEFNFTFKRLNKLKDLRNN